jgi:hypothetical protein
MAILGLCGIARAEPAQQFAFVVRGSAPGKLGVHVMLRAYDTTGVVPPTPAEYVIRLPRGVAFDEAFLNRRYFCDGTALRDALDARPSGVPFVQRIAHLDGLIGELARSHSTRDRAALANARACERGRLGGGTGLIDARDALPVLTDPIPVGFAVFLSRGSIPGAIAALTIVGSADERAAVIYTGPINGFQVSIAEVDATAHSLELKKGTCLARGREGRCTRRQREDAALFDVPRCPASGHFSAQLYTAFPPPAISLTTTLDVPCPRYVS